MRSSNPVFARSEEFNGRGNPYGTQTYPGNQAGFDGYGQQQYGVDAPGSDRMSIDSVVQKTGMTFLVLLVTAAATWWWIGDVSSTVGGTDAAGRALLLAMLGAGGAFVLSLVNSFKKVISPALVIAFAAAEGVALGAISKVFDAQFDGIVSQAVLGTFAAMAGTLAAYKFLNITVGDKFRKITMAGMFAMVGLGLLSLVLSLFGIQTGLFGFGPLGLLMSVIGLVLGVFMLILDFDYVERGVAAGLPERESWRAAFGLTVSLVWIYTNLLRILAIMRGD